MTERKTGTIPCCAADAVAQIRKVKVNGITVGLAMLDSVFAEVEALGPLPEEELKHELLKRVKIYNYIPRSAGDAYAAVLMREYGKRKKGEIGI
ncbi:MAG: hypothetical protein RQ758_06740 [Methanomicrobiaceae archaeon]|nr:hypothetical protein [Methanomicrobiaceae archaeon]